MTKRARTSSDQVTEAEKKLEVAREQCATTTQKILAAAQSLDDADVDLEADDFDEDSTVQHVEELRRRLARHPSDVKPATIPPPVSVSKKEQSP